MAGITDIFYLNEKGLRLPTLDEVILYFENEYKNIYGQDVVLTADTQDGQFLLIQAQALYDTMQVLSLVYNSYSPSTALSDALDRNVRINGIRRKNATFSTVDLTITGKKGTIIRNGRVKDNLDRTWLLPAEVVIPIEGETIATAKASEKGDLLALANTVNIIDTPQLGWFTVTNKENSQKGTPIESDADLRRRQAKSVALPSQTVLSGMIGAVSVLDGVTRLKAYENDTSVIDANGITPHSTALIVEGGVAQEIAEAISLKKTVGSGTYGDVTIKVTDFYGIDTNINFSRPKYINLNFKITIKPLKGYTSTYGEQIKERLVQAVNNTEIGKDLYITRLTPPILACNSSNTDTFDLISIEVKKEGDGDFTTNNVKILFNEVVTTKLELIEIVTDGD